MLTKRQDSGTLQYQRRPIAYIVPVCIIFVLSQRHVVLVVASFGEELYLDLASLLFYNGKYDRLR